MEKEEMIEKFKKLQRKGKKPSQIMKEHPELADALDDLVPAVAAERTGRGSGAGPSALARPSSSIEIPVR